MDVFKIDQTLSGNLGSAPSPDNITPEVSFDAGSEFNLCFFDTPEDSSTQGFSDPGSVGSVSAGSPPPQQLTTPLHIPLTGTSNTVAIVEPMLLSPDEAATSSIIVKQDQQYVAADSNSSTTTKSFVPCKVCGDKASGYHYGVTSCEGCKGFFRRSIQKQIEYRCLKHGKCLVIRLNRNRCQYCRFKKCLAVGMSRDSVRYGRVPKRSRERSSEEASRVTTSDAADQSPDAETKQLAVYDVILNVSQAHHANCGYTEDHTRNLVRKPITLPPPPSTNEEDMEVASSTAESMEQDRCWLWQQFATNITPSVQRVVEFAKRVPGFCDLGQDDQLILIKIGFFEIWLTHVARLTSNTSMMLDDGTTVSRQQLDVMYDTDFSTSVVHFANTFNALALNDTEVGLFSAVVLLTADRPGITEVKTIEHLQDKLIEALKVQVNRNHASEPQIFSNLLIKLPELRNLGLKHTSHLDWFRMNWQKSIGGWVKSKIVCVLNDITKLARYTRERRMFPSGSPAESLTNSKHMRAMSFYDKFRQKRRTVSSLPVASTSMPIANKTSSNLWNTQLNLNTVSNLTTILEPRLELKTMLNLKTMILNQQQH